ncbi:hypothetical protein SH668x_003191 [Planctomicrobium sp. SH668]|uniref:hypothetical protein n=1 Tax=Planctomicrobium sp. SH668 TaxID=3448126 RepID=UPI003F5B89D5
MTEGTPPQPQPTTPPSASSKPTNPVPPAAGASAPTPFGRPSSTMTPVPNSAGPPSVATPKAELEIPEFHLTQVQLDADIVADRVNLVVTVEVMINHGPGWHRVPLRFGGMHVSRREYTGGGEEAADTSNKEADEGLNWLFKGEGKHQLKLHGWVPLKYSVTGGQFQLTLPTLPSQFEARLKTRIPDPTAIVRSAKNLTVLDVKRTPEETTVESSIIGNLLLFSWQTPIAGGEVVSNVQTWLHLKPSAEHLALIVEQEIDLQQPTDSLLISLPPGFRLVQLTGQQYRSHEILPDRPNWVRVQFASNNLGRLTLNWGFERDFNAAGGTLQLEGFDVEGAVREEGRIRIDEFENLLMVPRPQGTQLVHAIGVNQVRSLGTGVPLVAYEYLRQPFRIEFEVQPSIPYFSVEPVGQLRFNSDSIDLTVNHHVRFERGAITELKLNWPDWMKEGWRVVSVSSDHSRTGPMAYDATSQPGMIRLWWPNPLGRKEGEAVFTTTFRKAVKFDQKEAKVEFTLPAPQASEVEPFIVRLDSADQLSVQLTKTDSSPLPRFAGVSELPELALVQTTPSEKSSRAYRIDQPSEPMIALIQSHDRETKISTQVQIGNVTATKLRVDQLFQFDVRYGRVRTFEIVIPPELKKHIPDWALTQGFEVTSQGRPVAVSPGETSDAVQVDLGAERIGQFDVTVSYSFPVPENASTRDIDLPVFSLKNEPFQVAECTISAVDSLQVRSGNKEWEALQTSPSYARWINSLKKGPVQSIPLTMGAKLADASQQFVADQVQVRTIFASDGSAESWAELQLERPQSRLVIDFPKGTEFKDNAFLMDGLPLPQSAITRRSGESDEVTITIPQHAKPKTVVTVRYRTPSTKAFGLYNRIKLPLPQFKGSVWVDETVWEAQLPQNNHMFTYPDLVPQFKWTRNYFFWLREPTPDFLRHRKELTIAEVPHEFQFAPQTFYAFRAFGPVPELSFISMNRSLILLIGAGFALLLGFIFWYFPATRNVFSIVVIFFLFSAASLWYVESMLLLLQPAIFGVLLALTATVIDSSGVPKEKDRPSSRLDRNPVTATEIKQEDSSLNSRSTRIYRQVNAGKSDRIES